MRKILVVLLFVVSLFASDENESIKHIELTKGQGSAWLYDKKSCSIRDQVLHKLMIKQKKEQLILGLSFSELLQVNSRRVKYLQKKDPLIKPYFIASIVVSTNARVLLDAKLSDVYRGGIGIVRLELEKYQNEKDLTIQFTDNHNHTTLYHMDISNYPSNAIGNVKKDIESIDYENLYPKAWTATDIVTAVKEMFGEKIEAKVKEQYKNLQRDKYAYSEDERGIHLLVEKDISSVYVFSTTTNNKSILLTMVHIPDKTVKFKPLFIIPVRENGEMLIVAKDKEGELHMSQLVRIKKVKGSDERTIHTVKLDK